MQQDQQQNIFSTQKKQSVNSFLSKLELGDLSFFDIIKYGFGLFGQTKAGKTTLAHYLIHNGLIGKGSNQEPYYELIQGNKFSQAQIGSNTQSQTQIPNELIGQDLASNENNSEKITSPRILDYSDSKGCFMVIANAYFHYRVFSKVQSLKFIITFNYDNLEGTMNKPVNTLVQFFQSFKLSPQLETQLFKATVFVFNKVRIDQNKEKTVENIKAKLQNVKTCSVLNNNRRQRDIIRRLIDDVISKNKIFIFERAKKDEKTKGNELLKAIHAKTTFWKRNIVKDSPLEKQVDLKDFQLTLGIKARQQASKSQKFMEDLQLITKEFDKRFSSAFGKEWKVTSLNDVLGAFLNDSFLKMPGNESYLQQIVRFNKRFNIYKQIVNNKKEYRQKRQSIKSKNLHMPSERIDKLKIDWIQKLEISQLIIKMHKNQNYQVSQDKRGIQHFKKVAFEILHILSQFKMITSGLSKPQTLKYTSTIEQFVYIVYRLLEQAITFKIIFSLGESSTNLMMNQGQFSERKFDASQHVFDFIQHIPTRSEGLDFQDQNLFFKSQQRYLQLVDIKPNESLPYYHELEDYYKKSLQINSTRALMEKCTQLKLLKLQSNSAVINTNEKICSLTDNLKNYEKMLFTENSQKNEQVYIMSINQLASQLSKVDPKIDNEKYKQSILLSIQLYQHTKNAYKVIQNYKLLIERLSKQENAIDLKQILLKYADYSSKHGRPEQGIEAYQHAYSLIEQVFVYNKDAARDVNSIIGERRRQREQISRKIGMLGIQKRYNPSQQYYDELLRKIYYGTLDQKIYKEISKLYQPNPGK